MTASGRAVGIMGQLESRRTTMSSTGSAMKTTAKPICSATKPINDGATSMPE